MISLNLVHNKSEDSFKGLTEFRLVKNYQDP